MDIDRILDCIHTSFVEYIENGLNLVNHKEKQLLESIQKMQSEKHIDLIDDFFTDKNIEVHYLKSSFLNAGLMYIFSQFEYLLGEIEKSTFSLFSVKQNKSKFDFMDMFTSHRKSKKSERNIIKKRMNEIVKLSSIIKEFENQHKKQWDRILDYQKIRNIVVHKNGTFDKKTLVKRFEKNYPDLKIFEQKNNTYNLYLSKEMLIQIDKEMTSFLKRFMELIYETYKKKNKTLS